MKDKTDNNKKNSFLSGEKKNPINQQRRRKEKDNTFIQKSKAQLKNKKPVSTPKIFSENRKISININQNININSNIKESGFYPDNKEKSSKPKTENPKKQANQKLKTFIQNYHSEKIFKSNLILSVQLSRRKSHDLESSYRMENLLDKNSKIESCYERQEQFIEFNINDNYKNNIYRLSNNCITTTKYNLFTFIPKGLLFQFFRLSNVYFLFTAVIQSIPLISPLTSLTAIIPLIFVLGVSLIREAIEDLVRHNYDNLNNNEEILVYRDNKFIKAASETLKHGEIILIYENKVIPADMILLDSGFIEGTCYVETSSLDGEKTLKLKVANKYTQGFISNDVKANKGIEKFIQGENYVFSGFIKINAPSPDLNYVNGTIHVMFDKKDVHINQEVIISINEFLLKGSILKNTNWIIGIVVYTGMNNKIILNSKKPRMKMSQIEKTLNYCLVFVFSFLMICCLICSIMHHFEYKSHQNFYNNFILLKDSPELESFICFFTYFLLLNTLIPISLIVSTEIIKMIQGIFISWDISLYSKFRHSFCGVKSVSIIEELGNVNFIFSDKTGTLTKNQLEFKFCIIDKKFYEYVKSYGVANKPTLLNFRDSKFQKYKKSFQGFLDNNLSLNNSKTGLINKLSVNNFIDKENEKYILNNNVNDMDNNKINNNNINIYKTKKFVNNNIHHIGNSLSNQNILQLNAESFFEKERPKSMNKKRKKKSIKISSSNSSSIITNGSKNSDNSDNSHKHSSICDQINNYNFKGNKVFKRNSTILELHNEDNFTASSRNEIVIFGEGYFSNINHNHFLKNIDLDNDPGFNYIHEFWKALSITNECMVKEEKGEIKYMGTSPDDLELVKAAMNQGYKLIETSINTKTVRIAGKDFSYEILKVLGFSSERKRMSIIVKDKHGIKLYSKGADTEISKRLSKKSLQSKSYQVITNGLLEFSRKGLRTLMIAYRKIKEDDYTSWINKLHEDELNVKNKHRLLERLYDIIENNLTLIGGTAVEDKLQDKVPETIKELRSAGIKIWVLTGDKLDTAENIGHSCNLLSKEQKLFELKVMPGDDEEIVKENPYREMTRFFSEFQTFVENLVKKYNLDTKYILYKKNIYKFDEIKNEENYKSQELPSFSEGESQNNENSFSKNSNFSVKSQMIDFEIFKLLKDKCLLEPFSIIIEAPILCGLFKDEEWTDNFLHIAYYANTVICCRVSPSQKSQVVKKMKDFDKHAVTLAIGDGGNDVSMIMEANIGIGVQGEEGVSAVQASDFSIGEFKILKKLLFIHGRVNLYRISNMILYFFFKNCVFTMVQFYFAFLNLGSGQTFIDDWYITCFNLIFTALPLCISALTDSDINIYNKKVRKNLSLLYKESRDNYRIFTFGRFILNLFKGAVVSLLIFITCCVKQLLGTKGFFANIWFISLKSYMCVLFVVSSNILLTNSFIVIYLPLSILISTFGLFFIFLVLNHYGILFEFNSKASIVSSLSSPILYCSVFFITCLSIVIDYSQKLFNLFFNESLIMRMNLRKAVKKHEKRRSSIAAMHNISSKSSNNNKNSIIANKKKSQDLTKSNKEGIEKTSNILLPKSTNYIFTKIKKIDFQDSKSNKFQNNPFTLKFKNNNNVLNYNDINKN